MAETLKPIRTGLASYGMSGSVFHAPYLHVLPEFELLAVVERSRKLVQQRFDYVASLPDFEALLADPRIELVIVNTPNSLHFDQALQALQAGKHVIVEKPMTITSHEADTLIEMAKVKGRVLSVYQNRRWDSDYLTVQRVIKSGMLGRVVEYEAHYDRFRNFVEDNTWKEKPGRGSGILYNLGSHMIDQALDLFGLPLWVYADIRSQRSGSLIDDNYEVVLDYGDVKATLKSSYMVREPGPRYMVYGEEGTFLKWGLDPQEEKLKAGILPNAPGFGKEPDDLAGHIHTRARGLIVKGRIESSVGNYAHYYQSIAQAIRTGSEPCVTAVSARAVIRVIELAMQSHYEGRRVPFKAI